MLCFSKQLPTMKLHSLLSQELQECNTSPSSSIRFKHDLETKILSLTLKLLTFSENIKWDSKHLMGMLCAEELCINILYLCHNYALIFVLLLFHYTGEGTTISGCYYFIENLMLSKLWSKPVNQSLRPELLFCIW